MDVLIWVGVALLLIALGVGMVLASRNGNAAAPMRGVGARLSHRATPRPSSPAPAGAVAGDEATTETADRPDRRAPFAATGRSAVQASPRLEALPDGFREEMRRAVADQGERLVRLEVRLVDLSQQVDRRLDDLVHDVRTGRDDAADRQAAVDARQEAALERLRADVVGQLGERGSERIADAGRLAERRLEVTADLYARVARLEAAVAAVTNPILLPGETYVPPSEFLDEALTWENWKDVGERAFALADAYSAQRLYLGEPTRSEVAAFVSSLRALLTRSVYPNLRPDPTSAQIQALRTALETLADELPKVRLGLEREFTSVSEPSPRRGIAAQD